MSRSDRFAELFGSVIVHVMSCPVPGTLEDA
jgi:hypothetical protein